MRKVLGARLLFSLSLVGAVGIWAACGGSDPQDVISNDAGSDTSTGEDSGGPEENDSGGKPDAEHDSGPPPEIYDAGEPNVLDGGDYEGGIPCVVGGELEEEPNDTREDADPLRPTRCGFIRVTEDGLDGGESDWLTFELADASTSFYVQYAGNVKVMVETDGQAPVDITAKPAPTIKFVKGQPYYAEVRSADGKAQTWRVTLFQK